MIRFGPDLRQEVETATGSTVVAVSPLSAANQAAIYRLSLSDKSTRVAKVGARGMDIEAWMLRYLAEKSSLPVPQVFYSTERMILMDFISADWQIDAMAQRNAAELLAALHNINDQYFGLERDTLIGSLHQPNTQLGNWVDFFRDQRLLYMAGKALEDGKLDAAVMKKIDRLAAKLDKYIDSAAKPSLIHGDVWGGNVLSGRGRIAAFLDPAIYYADPEIELAFTTLFHTFGSPFFQRYNEFHPIRDGFFEVRRHLYNLYPLLVHLRLFGKSYQRQIEQVLDLLG